MSEVSKEMKRKDILSLSKDIFFYIIQFVNEGTRFILYFVNNNKEWREALIAFQNDMIKNERFVKLSQKDFI